MYPRVRNNFINKGTFLHDAGVPLASAEHLNMPPLSDPIRNVLMSS